MRRRTLRCGIEVSDIGLGCWAIGGPFWDRGGWMGYGDVDDKESLRCLRRAYELGVTFYDTADVYGCGHSERLIGEAFEGKRDVVISDKFGFTFNESERKVTGQDASPQAIRSSLEASLRRLRREILDHYSLQLWDYPLEGIDDVLAVLDTLVAEGKIRSYSWLTDDLELVKYFTTHGKHVLGCPQLLNVLENSPELLAYCEQNALPALSRRSLSVGVLTGKFTSETTFPPNDMRTRFGWNFQNGKQAKWLTKVDKLREILTRDGRTLAQGALGWVLARSPLAMPCPGFKNLKQLKENIGAARFGPLTAEQVLEIDGVMRADPGLTPRPMECRPVGANQ